MRDNFKVIDADRHVLEPTDLFEKYLPAKFRGRVKIEGPNQSRRAIDGEPISDADRMRPTVKQEDYGFTFGASKRWRETFAEALAAKFDAASNVRDMDREGVDVSVLFPTLGLYIMGNENSVGAAFHFLPPIAVSLNPFFGSQNTLPNPFIGKSESLIMVSPIAPTRRCFSPWRICLGNCPRCVVPFADIFGCRCRDCLCFRSW